MIDHSHSGPATITGRHPIVVAVGPTGGTAVIRTAYALAARDDSDLVILSVLESPPAYELLAREALLEPWTHDDQLRERREQLGARLQRFTPLASQRARPPVLEVVHGEPAQEIARVARERHARLIVMGLGPFALARRLVAAGTAWSVGRRAPCPVLAVTERLHQLPRVVVAATDFSPESIHAAVEALPVLADGAELHLVHAWRPIESPVHIVQIEAANHAYAASVPQHLARVRTLLGGGHHVAIDTHAVEGKPAESLLGLARELHADLIVVGTHGHGLMERWLLGSTSTAVLRGAECSVLLVPSPPVAEHNRIMRQMTGTSTVRRPEHWNDELRAFVRRNQHRRTTLEIDDASIGAQVQESGYALVGATYDPHDRHLALMFGEGADPAAHLTRSLGDVRSVAVASGLRDDDQALCIESEHGSALLTFLDRGPTPPSSAFA